jgi:hypothetical protein
MNLMVTNSASSDRVGSVNGVGQSCASIARAVGPAAGGAMWSLSEASAAPGHQFVVFVFVAAVAAGALSCCSRGAVAVLLRHVPLVAYDAAPQLFGA